MNAIPLFTPRALPVGALSLCFALLFSGCVSNRYKEAKKDIPPPQMLNVAFAPAPLAATLNTLITYNGPGSWKRNAFWDEYVVTLHNPGSQPLTVSSVALVDFTGTTHAPGDKPWILEKESKTLERKYKEAGIAFVRYTGPALLILGTGLGVAASSGILTTAAAGAMTVTLVALPLYFLGVVSINQSNKADMEREFNHRRIELPLTLAPGETRTGSFFFPMVPSPRSLDVRWSTGTASGDSVLPLDFLSGLHLQPPPASTHRPRKAAHSLHKDTY